MLLLHELFHHAILLLLLLNACLQFLLPQLHFLLSLIAFAFLFLSKVLHYIIRLRSSFCSFLRGLQRFHLPRFIFLSDLNVPWRFSCAPLPLFFPPFLCSLPRSFFYRLTSPCQLFLQELGLALTPYTKCQSIFLFSYFCFILSNNQSRSVSYWSFVNFESWMIKAVEVNSNVVPNISSFLGFAKSRPTAHAHGPRRPSGPRLTARDGPAARNGPSALWPSPDFPQFFCPPVNSHACTDLHRVWACKMDDGEFEFSCHDFW